MVKRLKEELMGVRPVADELVRDWASPALPGRLGGLAMEWQRSVRAKEHRAREQKSRCLPDSHWDCVSVMAIALA
jgi:hypothetical protein